MSGTYKLITIVGTSRRSFADAVKAAMKTAAKTVRGISWFEVDELRGSVENDKVKEYQVTLRAGFRVDPDKPARKKVTRRRR